MIDLASVPPLRGARPADATAARRRTRSWPTLRRRTVLQAAVAGGTALGFGALGVFPAARRAYADGFDIYTGPCPSYAASHDCSPGCGPSMIFADSCETSGPNLGFHRSDGVTWMLRPNQCFDGTFDGWLWRYNGACGTCSCFVERRCHDGFRQVGGSWVRSICRWNTDCGCRAAVFWPTVRRGETSGNVAAVQYLATFRGFATTADGIFGPNTEAVVRQFQQSVALPATGVVDEATWLRLILTIRRGDSSTAVRAGQRELDKYGYALVVDGIFGAATEAAASDFQRQNGLTADGVIGPTTWRTLAGGGTNAP